MNHIVIDCKLFFECGFVPHFLGLYNLSETVLLVVITSIFYIRGCICRYMARQLHMFMSGDKIHNA